MLLGLFGRAFDELRALGVAELVRRVESQDTVDGYGIVLSEPLGRQIAISFLELND